jgi:predicted nucleic acid-binding Zn ribbon protein
LAGTINEKSLPESCSDECGEDIENYCSNNNAVSGEVDDCSLCANEVSSEGLCPFILDGSIDSANLPTSCSNECSEVVHNQCLSEQDIHIGKIYIFYRQETKT